MAGENTAVQMSFSSGELAYPLRKRTDWARRDQGAEEILNGLVLSTGGTVKRPGMRFIGSCLHDDKPCSLIEFEFSPDQIYVLELGDNIMRVYWDGGVVLNEDGTEYRIQTPYTAQQATQIRYAQDQDALFFAHINVMPQRLTRYGHTDWRWAPMFADVTRIASPLRIDFVGEDGDGHNNYEYAVTAYRQIDGARQESIGYPVVFSDPNTADFIAEIPNSFIESCYSWHNKYTGKYGEEPGFPSIPQGFAVHEIPRDQTAPRSVTPPASVYGGVNQRLFDLLKQVYPSLAYVYNYHDNWTSAPSISIEYWCFRDVNAAALRPDIGYVGWVGSGSPPRCSRNGAPMSMAATTPSSCARWYRISSTPTPSLSTAKPWRTCART